MTEAAPRGGAVPPPPDTAKRWMIESYCQKLCMG